MTLHLPRIMLLLALVLAPTAAVGGDLAVDLVPDPKNPPTPQMGDRLLFHSVIRNDGTKPADGVIAWLSLLQIDRGAEQPIDLEDWSAQKAVTADTLRP